MGPFGFEIPEIADFVTPDEAVETPLSISFDNCSISDHFPKLDGTRIANLAHLSHMSLAWKRRLVNAGAPPTPSVAQQSASVVTAF